MFGWFKRKQEPDLRQAYELGQRAMKLLHGDIERWVDANKHNLDGYLEVLNGQFDKCVYQKDKPPLMAATLELKAFCEQLDKVRPNMMSGLVESLGEYQKLLDLTTIRDAFQNRIDKCCKEFAERGLDALVKRTPELEVADANWRRLHPELSAHFPETSSL